jgi:hypothetical protein
MASFKYTFASGDTLTPARLNDARDVFDIVNADIKSDAAIAGTKISPNFGSQFVQTTGGLLAGGNITTSSSDGATSIIASASGNNTDPCFLQFRKSRGTSAAPTVVTAGDTLGSTAYFGYDGSNVSLSASLGVTCEGTIGTDSVPARFTFATRATGGGFAERMRITSGGLVGIATSTPATTLDVNGDVTITDKIIHSGDTDTAIRFPSNDTVTVETNGSERLRVSSVGYVGIGRTPASPLEVEGDFVGYKRAGGHNHFLYRSNGTLASPTVVAASDQIGRYGFGGYDGDEFHLAATIECFVDGTPGNNDMPGRLVFRTTPDGGTNLATRMTIKQDGKIGINVTSPATILDVNGDVTITDKIIHSGDTDTAIRFPSADTMTVEVGGNERLRVTSSGVSSGSGASFGNITATAAAGDAAYVSLGTAFTSGYVSFDRATNILTLWNAQNGVVYFGANNARRMTLNASGQLGIGTNVDPTTALTVAGDITLSSATTATAATAGTNGDVPAQVAGYLVVSINGTSRKIPYYAT